MRGQKTEWPHAAELEPEMELDANLMTEDQPQFGLSVLWSGTSVTKPCLIIHLWRRRIQVGWMP